MLTIRPIRFSLAGCLFIVAIALLGLPVDGFAQGFDRGDRGDAPREREREDEISAPEILNQGIDEYNRGNIDEAIDFFFQYIDLTRESKLDTAISVTQDVRFKLAGLLVNENRLAEAAAVLEDYVKTPFAKFKRIAYKIMVKCYFDLEDYATCAPTVLKALEYDENPDLIVRADMNSLDAERGTFGDGDKKDDPYTPDEHIELRFRLAESYYNLSKYQECIEPYEYVISRTQDKQRKGYSIMQMIQALVELENFDRIMEWVPVLYRSDARYDIRVNLALMSVADALYGEGEYDAALPLYRMIVPRDELIAYQEEYLQQIRIDAGLPPLLGQELTEDEKLLFGDDEEESEGTSSSRPVISGSSSIRRGSSTSSSVTEEDSEFEIPPEIAVVDELLTQLKNPSLIPPYENFVNLQMAMLYKNVYRYWESIRFFDKVYKEDPGGAVGQRAVYEAVNLLLNDLHEDEDARNRAYDFMGSHTSGVYPRYVAYLLTGYFQERDDWRKLTEMRPYLDGFDESYDKNERRYDSELFFMQAVGELMQQHYTNAMNDFTMVYEEYTGAQQAPNALYWCGFSYLCLDNHQKAYECFDRYTQEFPGETMVDEAYFQGGIALFGMDRLDEAVERFSYVVKQFGESSAVYSDALNMRADITAAKEAGAGLDDAVADYRESYRAAKRVGSATYAVFAACAIFQKDRQNFSNEDIEELVTDYVKKWGHRGGDLAKALLWLGRVKMERQEFNEAVADYKKAILQYGGLMYDEDDVYQDGVDQLIPEMIKMSRRMKENEREELESDLRVQMEDAENLTLKLRLRVALALFNGTESELGSQLLNEQEDLSVVPPPVLDLICKSALEQKDYSNSEEILELFRVNFKDSPYINSAFELRANALVAQGDYDRAYDTVVEMQELFGTVREAAWAQLLKARVLLAKSKQLRSDELLTMEDLQAEASDQLVLATETFEFNAEKLANNDPETVLSEASVEQLEEEQGQLELRIEELKQAQQGALAETRVRELLANGKLNEAREQNKNVMGVADWRGLPVTEAMYQLGELEEYSGNLALAYDYYKRVYFLYKGVNNRLSAMSYLACARCLQMLAEQPARAASRQEILQGRMDTLQSMLLDEYVNIPENKDLIDQAKELMGSSKTQEIETIIDSGVETNIVITINALQESEKKDDQ